MKSLNLPKESQEALLNGASMFLVTCVRDPQDYGINRMMYIKAHSLYQIGDEFHFDGYKIIIKDIKVVKVKDIDYELAYTIQGKKESKFWSDCENEVGIFVDWYNKQYGNYDDNPYVFLYEIERLYK